MFHVMLVLPGLVAAYAVLNVLFSGVAWLVLWRTFFRRRVKRENLRRRTAAVLSVLAAVGFGTATENVFLFLCIVIGSFLLSF